LLKQAAAFELIDAIDIVMRGGSFVTPGAAKGQAEISLREPKDRDRTSGSSPRQRAVIRLLAEGCSMKGVASILKITTRTVAAHKCSAMELLQLKTNAELVQYAIKRTILLI
jgi:two-component system, NarL family, response regulator NreC